MNETVATVAVGPHAPRHRRRRGHGLLTHTADVGIRAAAPSLETLFEEGAAALAELGADVDHDVHAEDVAVELEADDLEQLAFWWLNELIALADDRGEAVVGSKVEIVQAGRSECSLRGRASFAPFDGLTVRPHLQLKAATMHRLRVARVEAGWELEAYLDV